MIISYFTADYFAIYGTSLLGSYIFIRGLSLFFGGFPNEYLIYNSLKNNLELNLPFQFYLYLLLIVILFMQGVARQNKKYVISERERERRRREEEEPFYA